MDWNNNKPIEFDEAEAKESDILPDFSFDGINVAEYEEDIYDDEGVFDDEPVEIVTEKVVNFVEQPKNNKKYIRIATARRKK